MSWKKCGSEGACCAEFNASSRWFGVSSSNRSERGRPREAGEIKVVLVPVGAGGFFVCTRNFVCVCVCITILSSLWTF